MLLQHRLVRRGGGAGSRGNGGGKRVDALAEAGLRDKVKVIIGGAPISAEFAEEIGADGYGADAFNAVRVVEDLQQDS